MEKDAVQLSWNGVIVINCNLVNSTPSTPTCYFLVPRNGYVGMHTSTVMDTFGPLIKDVAEPQLWFSFESQPIPWHIPIGVVLDRIAARKGIFDPMSLLPLPLTANFANFPVDKIIKFRDIPAAKAYYSHTIKAAMSVMYGAHADTYGRLSPRSYTQVTDCMAQNDAESFVTTSVKLKNIAGKPVIRYPVILHTDGGASSLLAVEAAEADTFTLGHFLRKYVPALFAGLTDEDVVSDGTGGQIVLVQSTLPLLSTPFVWLCENMCCADHFLHVVAHAGPVMAALTI